MSFADCAAWSASNSLFKPRRVRWRVFFKDGSDPTGLGQLVHQADRREGDGRAFAMA